MAEAGAYSGPTCAYCGGIDRWNRPLQRDHVIPRSWDGSSNKNVVLACPSCNGTKGNRDPVLWFAELVRRYGAVVGRDETREDVIATRIWERWGDDIEQFATTLTSRALASANSKDDI